MVNALYLLSYFVLGISLTILFVHRFNLGAVGGASLTMIVAGIAEKVFPFHKISMGSDFTNIMVMSAFVSMSSLEILGDKKDILLFSIVGTFCYKTFSYTFAGIGGSMGMSAFVTVILSITIKKGLSHLITIFKIS